MKKSNPLKSSAPSPSEVPSAVDLGENPVNTFYARQYAKESSPSTLAVLLELTENARDNATDVTITIDVESSLQEKGNVVLVPRKIICEDNGTGLTHQEFLNRFCGAFADSDAHFDTDKAGRNGVGTKTYTSIAERVVVKTTTGRMTEGLDQNRSAIEPLLPVDLSLPHDGEPDTVWRVYDFQLHTRAALAPEWQSADALEMGTRVELTGLHEGTRISYQVLLERLSYAREWLQNGTHSMTLNVIGNAPESVKKKIEITPWIIQNRVYLTEARGKSNKNIHIFDPANGEATTIEPPAGFGGIIEFDFRVAGRDADGLIKNLDRPALLLEVCGALPYAPNLEGNQSSRTLPLLAFVGLENASSIGAFCNAVCGWARINTIDLKQALRNNKTTLASGPGNDQVQLLREYLRKVLKVLHGAWYSATRQGSDDVTKDAIQDAAVEVNLALKGANRNPFKGGDIVRATDGEKTEKVTPPVKRHRWECGACSRRWLAAAAFVPTQCAEADENAGVGDGCGSVSIGLAKNQPRIGDCEIRVEPLGNEKIPAVFQFDKIDDDLELPVVRVNKLSPRYVELRGMEKTISGQAQRRLKQYLVDVSLVSIAEYHARITGSEVSEELGELYFSRMLRFPGGIKQYQAMVAHLLDDDGGADELLAS